MSAPNAIRAFALLYAHFHRVPLDDGDMKQDQAFVVSKAIKLVQGMMQIAIARQWLVPALHSSSLSQFLVQGMWESQSALLQLPYMDFEIIKHCVNGKRAIRSIADLLDMSEGDRRSLLKGLSDEQYREVIAIAQTFPAPRVDAVSFRVLGQDQVTPGGLITCQVRLSLEYAKVGTDADGSADDDKGKGKEPATKLEDEVETFEFDEDGNLMDEPARKLGSSLSAARPVYCPHFANVKRPNWWVSLVNKNHTNLVATPVKILDLVDSKTVTLQFPAPPKPLNVSLLLVVRADAVVGVDVTKEVKFAVVAPVQQQAPEERWEISGDEEEGVVFDEE